jgi:calcineurin-like phosphoesterase family protein
MNYYIGDLHFGHTAAINFDQRPFDNVGEMDGYMIRAWNARCDKNSQIYILGDFAFRNEQSFSWYLKQLKGQKHLIVGNHDTRLLKDSEAMSYFVSVDYYREISDCQKHIVLSHYPIAEWNGFYSGSYHIYGHIHGKTDGAFLYMKQYDHALNAAAVINNYMPVTFGELIENNRIFKDNMASERV